MSNVIEIEGLTKDYATGFWKKKNVRALDGLSLSVESGRIFGFLGGNGAGKTTTIKILMGLLFANSGTARVLGHDISDIDMHQRVGYCPENPYFYDYLTPLELMTYLGELFGQTKSVRKQRAEELLSRVGLSTKDWNKHLRKFSKGMLQRVALAQSLINDPELVIMDEPMSGLDPLGRREVRELISNLREGGKTVFMSTHILSDIEALCDEVAILRNGKLAAAGKLEDLLANTGEQRAFEISVSGISVESVRAALTGIETTGITGKASGAVINAASDSDIEKIIAGVRSAGGKLNSIQPVRLSLEELFVEASQE